MRNALDTNILAYAECLGDALRCQSAIELPTLRSRKEDIGSLTEHFLRRIAGREGKPPRSIMIEALHVLQNHEWPGNVRELENVLQRALVMSGGGEILAEHLMLDMQDMMMPPVDMPTRHLALAV